MSLRLCIPDALGIVTGNSTLMQLLGSDATSRVTFARAMQGIAKPYMTLNVGAADYESTVSKEDASAAYRIDYITYHDTAQGALQIHDALFDVLQVAISRNFDIRILDEDYFVDVDGVHRATISVVFRTNLTKQRNA